jgi:hypothetical protein
MSRPVATFVALAALASAHAVASPAGPAPSLAPPTPPRCSPAAIADVRLPFPVGVDEIHVIVSESSPATSAAEVTVDAGAFDRVLHVRGGSHALTFHPALTSAEFRVSLDPVFTAGSPCIERIELRRGGAAIATVVP